MILAKLTWQFLPFLKISSALYNAENTRKSDNSTSTTEFLEDCINGSVLKYYLLRQSIMELCTSVMNMQASSNVLD